MSYGGTPKPLGPEFEELARQRERERDAERQNAAVVAEVSHRTPTAGSRLDRLKRALGLGRERTR